MSLNRREDSTTLDQIYVHRRIELLQSAATEMLSDFFERKLREEVGRQKWGITKNRTCDTENRLTLVCILSDKSRSCVTLLLRFSTPTVLTDNDKI